MSTSLARSILVVGAVFLYSGARASESYKPKYIPNAAQICVERFEGDGLTNIVLVTIIISQVSKITLLGGGAGCLIRPDGNETIGLSFSYPYSGPQVPRLWTTTPRNFVAKGGLVVSFELCEVANQQVNDPQWAANGWHNMWLLRQVGKDSSQRCADEK
jgi:hypothetical protein